MFMVVVFSSAIFYLFLSLLSSTCFCLYNYLVPLCDLTYRALGPHKERGGRGGGCLRIFPDPAGRFSHTSAPFGGGCVSFIGAPQILGMCCGTGGG
jgi:hypothetical protein